MYLHYTPILKKFSTFQTFFFFVFVECNAQFRTARSDLNPAMAIRCAAVLCFSHSNSYSSVQLRVSLGFKWIKNLLKIFLKNKSFRIK